LVVAVGVTVRLPALPETVRPAGAIAVQVEALVLFQVSVVLWPALTDVGEAVSVAVGTAM
jgi:hypothetical protein